MEDNVLDISGAALDLVKLNQLLEGISRQENNQGRVRGEVEVGLVQEKVNSAQERANPKNALCTE